MSKYEGHTPEPWHAEELSDEFFYETNHKYGISSPAEPTHWVAKVEGWGAQGEANSQLIADAPKLLRERNLCRAACEAALELRDISSAATQLAFSDTGDNRDLIRKADAIEKQIRAALAETEET